MSHNGSSETSSFIDEGWASWFCNLAGNHFFCEVDKAYMEDPFNLFGLKQYLPKDYPKALDAILDRLAPNEAETEELSRSAALLYGLIHARYIITSHGLEAMHRKYLQKDFGECPRMLCRGQAVLPMGFTDDPKHGMVKLFCPKCQDVYSCAPTQRHIDGAFFGPTFPNLFFMTYEDLVPEPVSEQYVPRVFGFRIHHTSNSLPRPGRAALGLYSGYASRSGLSAAGMAFGVGHNHSLLTQGNLANNNNNGNHTSTSISESQSAVSKGVVGGKRRHQGYHTSASDGHQSATGTKQPTAGVMTGTIIPSGVVSEAHLASLVQIPSTTSASTTSALTYTGLDGKIGIDIIESVPVDGRGSTSSLNASNLSGLGLALHPHTIGSVPVGVGVNVNVAGLPAGLSPGLPHQRLIPLAYDRSDDIIEMEHFPAKRSRHTLTSVPSGNGGEGSTVDMQGV